MNPRTALSGDVKRKTYAAWFLRPGWAQGGEFWQLELSAPQVRAVQRLPWDRTRCRWRPAGLQR